MRKSLKFKGVIPQLNRHEFVGCGFNYPRQLKEYATRLIGFHDHTEEFNEFILSLLSITSRRKFVDFIYSNKRGNAQNNYENCLESLNSASELAHHITIDLSNLKIRIHKEKLRERLILLFQQDELEGNPGLINNFETELLNMRNLFNLREEEIKIISFLYCQKQSISFEKLCNSHPLSCFLNFVSIATGISFGEVKRIVHRKAKLVESGMVDIDLYCVPYLSLSISLLDYMTGINDVPLAEKFCKRAAGPVFEPNSFTISEVAKEIIQSLLLSKDPCHILLYGPAGTGKTEFAKSVVASCGKQAFFVQHGDDGEVADRRLALRAAVGAVSGEQEVIIFDEADTFLNTAQMFISSGKTAEKGWINNFLDSVKRKIIWITNDTSCIEQSVLRRFSFSWHFKSFTKRERENIWSQLVKDHPLKGMITPEIIRNLAAQHQVNAAGIASALDTTKAILPPEKIDQETVLEKLNELLTRHEDLTGQGKKTPFNRLTDHYDINALNVDVDKDQLINSLRNFTKKMASVDWKEDGNLNLLFWGKPGTGKTEFAKFLTKEIGMDLIIKRASDLLGPYVGQTEWNIKEAFEEAERQKAILFIDEADSFFINRETAHRSWEVSQSNELLTQMENYRGILICCTNLLHNLDKASMRRFNWKVEFRPLTEQGKVQLFENYFGSPENKLTPKEIERLKSIPNLTAGDIKAVWQKFTFLQGSDRTHRTLLEALEREAAYKGQENSQVIGFQRG